MNTSVEILEPLETLIAKQAQPLTTASMQADQTAFVSSNRFQPVHRGKSLLGKGKLRNEDRHLAHGARQHFALFDGLGSASNGANVAAKVAAVLADLEFVSRDPHLLTAQVEAALSNLNQQIFAWSEAANLPTGCTLAGLVRAEGGALLYAAGDTRAYRYRGGLLTQLTVDHRAFDPVTGRPGVARALGAAAYLPLDMRLIDIRSGDIYLLCTDGVHGALSDAQLAMTFSMAFEVDEQCAILTEQLLGAEPLDDASFLLIPGSALIKNFRGNHG